METEKLKQMGRDYFTANPKEKPNPMKDEAYVQFWQEAWIKDRAGKEEAPAVGACRHAWLSGWNEARYTASKEGRAIELLGRWMLVAQHFEVSSFVVDDTSEFLQEIGWKPTP